MKPAEGARAASLLDRLRGPGQAPPGAIEALRQDLELLLNETTAADPASGLPHLSASLVNFGAPDLNSVDMASPQARERALQAIARAITRWEPRLRHVRVTLAPQAGADDRTLAICIEAEATEGWLRFQAAIDPLSHAVRLGRQP